MLGVQPQLGRSFASHDDQTGAPPVVLLSDAIWRRHFAADHAIVGRVVSIDQRPYTVVGVMPPGFKFPEMSELWLPIASALPDASRDTQPVSVVTRLGAGQDIRQASAEVASIVFAAHGRDFAGVRTAGVGPLQTAFMGSDDRIVTSAMLGGTLFLLLIACANVANLLLTRAISRQREFAVRTALGATRRRLARQALTEGMLLAVAACAIALPLARQALRWIQAAVPLSDPYPYYVHWTLDGRTFAYAVAASLVTGGLFGLAPAMHVAGRQLSDALKEGSHGAGTGRRSSRARKALVVGEVTLALILLVGASLFVRTFVGLRRTDLGYDPDRIMTMRFFLSGAHYDAPDARAAFVEDLVGRLEALPDVSAATISDLIPLDDEGGAQGHLVVDGAQDTPDEQASIVSSGVAGRWFQAFGVRLLAGRVFTDQEVREKIPLAVINHRMADQFWPGVNAIGRRFRLTSDPSPVWYTVIGIAPDIRTVKLDENRGNAPEAYLPSRFVPTRDYGVIVRTDLAPAAVTRDVQRAIHAADPTVPVFNVRTMDEVRYLSFWMYAVWGTLFAVFGGIALLLAAVGVFAVMFYSVAQRTSEIGVRMALGAERQDIVRLVLGQGTRLAAIGVVLGLLGALALTPVVGGLLIGVSPTDPVSFGVVAVLLFSTAALASYVPALRATHVDPVVALRQE